ncbi:hypothetical protein RFI_35065, partial [Reticulomyxa filosa]
SAYQDANCHFIIVLSSCRTTYIVFPNNALLQWICPSIKKNLQKKLLLAITPIKKTHKNYTIVRTRFDIATLLFFMASGTNIVIHDIVIQTNQNIVCYQAVQNPHQNTLSDSSNFNIFPAAFSLTSDFVATNNNTTFIDNIKYISELFVFVIDDFF